MSKLFRNRWLMAILNVILMVGQIRTENINSGLFAGWQEPKLNALPISDDDYGQVELDYFDQRNFGWPQMTTEQMLIIIEKIQQEKQRKTSASKDFVRGTLASEKLSITNGQDNRRSNVENLKDINISNNKKIDNNDESVPISKAKFPYEFVTLQQLGEKRKNKLLLERLDVKHDKYKNSYFALFELIPPDAPITEVKGCQLDDKQLKNINEVGLKYLNYMRSRLLRVIADSVKKHWPKLKKMVDSSGRNVELSLLVRSAFIKVEREFVLNKLARHNKDMCTPIFNMFSPYLGVDREEPKGGQEIEDPGKNRADSQNSLFTFMGTIIVVHSQRRHLLVIKIGEPPKSSHRSHSKAIMLLHSKTSLENETGGIVHSASATDIGFSSGLHHNHGNHEQGKQANQVKKIVDLGESGKRTGIYNRLVGLRRTQLRMESYKVSQWGQMKPLMLLMVSGGIWPKKELKPYKERPNYYKMITGSIVNGGSLPSKVAVAMTVESLVDKLSEFICFNYNSGATQFFLSLFAKQYQQQRMRQFGLMNLNKYIRQKWLIPNDISLLMAYMNGEYDWQANTHLLCHIDSIQKNNINESNINSIFDLNKQNQQIAKLRARPKSFDDLFYYGNKMKLNELRRPGDGVLEPGR